MTEEKSWYVYILECSDTTLYCGITTDLPRREREHNESNLGARYTRTRRPVKLVYSESVESRSMACKREWQIKRLSRQNKLTLISEYLNESLS